MSRVCTLAVRIAASPASSLCTTMDMHYRCALWPRDVCERAGHGAGPNASRMAGRIAGRLVRARALRNKRFDLPPDRGRLNLEI